MRTVCNWLLRGVFLLSLVGLGILSSNLGMDVIDLPVLALWIWAAVAYWRFQRSVRARL